MSESSVPMKLLSVEAAPIDYPLIAIHNLLANATDFPLVVADRSGPPIADRGAQARRAGLN
jgi:hypothetical protein